MAVVRAARVSPACSLPRGLEAGSCLVGRQLRRFAWEADDKSVVKFKVKSDAGSRLAKLAGGILMRAEQSLETELEAAGSRSVYNAVRALVLANRFCDRRRAEAAAEGRQPSPATPMRFAFIPKFGRRGENLWMRLLVVPMANPPLRRPEGSEAAMRVSQKTDLNALRSAVFNQWMQHCLGRQSQPLLACMGAESAALSVKASAFAARELGRRKGGERPFLLSPSMAQVPSTAQQSEPQTVLYFSVESQPGQPPAAEQRSVKV